MHKVTNKSSERGSTLQAGCKVDSLRSARHWPIPKGWSDGCQFFSIRDTYPHDRQCVAWGKLLGDIRHKKKASCVFFSSPLYILLVLTMWAGSPDGSFSQCGYSYGKMMAVTVLVTVYECHSVWRIGMLLQYGNSYGTECCHSITITVYESDSVLWIVILLQRV